MKTYSTLLRLSLLILVLAAIAAGWGVLDQGQGEPVPFTTVRGETVLLQGRGLYRYDSVSIAAQAVGQDLVTLFVGLPMLALASLLTARGSLRGRLLLTGTLGYLLYTYASYSFTSAFNVLFLLYVALFGLNLFAFILAITSFDVQALPAHFTSRMPRVPAASFFFLLSAFLLLAWLGRIIPALLSGAAPVGIDSSTTLVIQALDLGVIVPIALVTGILLLRRRPLGYLLATVVLVKGFTMSSALVAMIVTMLLAGVPVAAFEAIVFPALTVIGIALMVQTLRSIREQPGQSAAPAGQASSVVG